MRTGPVSEVFRTFADAVPRSRPGRLTGPAFHDLLAACVAGLRWFPGDPAEIESLAGTHHGYHVFRVDERAYAAALAAGNKSAQDAIADHLGRSHFEWPHRVSYGSGCALNHDRGRVGEGTMLRYRGDWWRVSSVHDDRFVIVRYDGERPNERRVHERRIVRLADLPGIAAEDPEEGRRPFPVERLRALADLLP